MVRYQGAKRGDVDLKQDDSVENPSLDMHSNGKGPPPNMTRRCLIFDSLQALLSRGTGPSAFSENSTGGTYVYTWGAGYNGQLGRKHGRGARKYSKSPMNVIINAPVRHVAAGGLHSAVVTESGDLYTWGDGRYSQLGHTQDGFVNQPVPKLVQALSSRVFAVQVTCGHGHTVALTKTGELMSWGWSKHGQTGLGTTKTKVVYPTKVQPPDRNVVFTQVAAGDRHTIALTDKGHVYSFGNAEHGQLGLGHDTHDVPVPKMITSIKKHVITFIDAGSNYSGMITQEKKMMICGFGNWLYPGEQQNFFYDPKVIDVREQLRSFAAGHSHIVALTVKGDVVTWGSGTWGQLGNGVKGNTPNPRCVLEGKKIIHVAAGRYHSFALTNFGTLYSWGNNDNGQAAQEEQEFALPRVIEPMLGAVVGHIVCGEHHTVALTSVLWSKPAQDVAEWNLGERHELTLKQKLLGKTAGGIGRRELNAIKQQMKEWKDEQSVGKLQSKSEEVKITAAQMKLIKSPDMITEDAKRKVKLGLQISRKQTMNKKKNDHHKEHVKKTEDVIETGREDGSAQGGFAASPRPKAKVRNERKSQAARAIGTYNTLNVHSTYTQETRMLLENMKQKFEKQTMVFSDEYAGKVFEKTCEQRKIYDNLKCIVVKKERQLKMLKDDVRYLKNDVGASSKENSKFDKDLNQLTMQLDTVTIKILETAENRRNYEQNIAHLKEEQLERFFFTDGLRRQGAEVAALYRKLEILKRDALKKQEESEDAVTDFKNDIVRFREFFLGRLSEYHTIVTMRKEEMSQRNAMKRARDKKSNSRVKHQVSKLTTEVQESEQEYQRMKAVLDTVTERLRFLEESYWKIVNATGLSNIDAIIQKYHLKEDVRLDLEAEVRQYNSKTEKLRKKEEELRKLAKQVQQDKVDTCWRDIDNMEEQERDAHLAMNYANEADMSVTHKLALFQAGIQNFFSSTLAAAPEAFTEGSQNVQTGSDTWDIKDFAFAFQEVENLYDELKKVVIERRTGVFVRPAKRIAFKGKSEKKDTVEEIVPDIPKAKRSDKKARNTPITASSKLLKPQKSLKRKPRVSQMHKEAGRKKGVPEKKK